MFVNESQLLLPLSDSSATISAFRQFVLEAQQLQPSADNSTTLAKFFEFVQNAQMVVIRPPASGPLPVADFRSFIGGALPIVVSNIKCMMPRIAERAALAERWLVRHDLLQVANFGFVEDSWTELMAWALAPATHPETSVKRQKAWLKAMGLDEDICETMACIPQSQFVTDDGVPDLVLHFDKSTVVVEAKTGSAEHPAPSSKKWQTEAYGESVRRALNLPPEHKVIVVFITPDRRLAKDPEAILTTFIEFVIALCEALDSEQLPTDTRSAYAMLFTHFLTQSVPTSLNVAAIISQLSTWSKQPDWLDEDQLIMRKDELLAAVDLLIPEHTQ
jgi:hypothetical protein